MSFDMAWYQILRRFLQHLAELSRGPLVKGDLAFVKGCTAPPALSTWPNEELHELETSKLEAAVERTRGGVWHA